MATPKERSDIKQGTWVNRLLPEPLQPYATLMRLDRPIGWWLLLLPGWWAIALAADEWPSLKALVLFLIGAVIMRGAGCVFNDITDRDIDSKVARTAERPITSGRISVPMAFIFMGFLFLLGGIILVQFNWVAVVVGACSVFLIFPYPYFKRITYWPQIMLGLVFSWAALTGWAAVRGDLDWPALTLYLGAIFWTIGYDTIYAHQDKDDDILIGVKSSALYLKEKTKPALWAFFTLAVGFIGVSGYLVGLGWYFYAGLGVAAAFLAWQVIRLDTDDPFDCLKRFRANRDFGLIITLAIIAGRVQVPL